MYDYSSVASPQRVAISRSAFFNRVYAWMASGLALTAIIGAWIHNSAFAGLAYKPGVFWSLFAVEMILVLAISIGGATGLSAVAGTMLFMLYSAINGVTLSAIFAVYAKHTIYQAFFVSAGTFGVMSLYGMLTKRDLTSVGAFLGMALWGLLIALIVSIFFASTLLEYAINFAGVVIFTGLTAYDTQKLKEISDNDSMAPVGSLILYLDFVNLFLYILRILGGSKSDD